MRTFGLNLNIAAALDVAFDGTGMADIVIADLGGGFLVPRNVSPFGSVTIPDCAIQMLLPCSAKQEAADIVVPFVIASRVGDVHPEPHMEPSAYCGRNDIATVIMPNVAHMYNFASTRALLWERLVHWYRQVADNTSARREDL
jgi:hypothetical protein